jgi:hypothetical protein
MMGLFRVRLVVGKHSRLDVGWFWVAAAIVGFVWLLWRASTAPMPKGPLRDVARRGPIA